MGNAAAQLRRFTAASNQLHQTYLGHRDARAAYATFVARQMDYLVPQYAGLTANAEEDEAVDFVLTHLVGAQISERDRQLEKILPLMTRTLPDVALASAALAMEVNAATLAINLKIYAHLAQHGTDLETLSERSYCLAARQVSQHTEVDRLVRQVREAGDSLESLVRIPFIATTLVAMRVPARLAGVRDLQHFLEQGYRRFRALPNATAFIDKMEHRMHAVFANIYQAAEQTLSDKPIPPQS